MNEKLLNKMKALLKMAQDAANENESEIAMRRLHFLLAKHNVSMTDLEFSHETEEVGEGSFKSYTRPWQKVIMVTVAELYFCKVYISGGRKADVFVVGTEVNRSFAMGMIQHILHTINIASQHEATRLYPNKDTRWSRFQTSFLSGASSRISSRCRSLIDDAKSGNLSDGSGNTLPVMASVYDRQLSTVEAFMQDLNLREGRNVNLTAKDSRGVQAGRDAANKIQLTRSLQKQNSQKMLA